MINKVKAAALVSTAILGATMVGTTFAANGATVNSGTTKSYISFHEKSDGTTPIDPSDPNSSDGSNSTGNKGPLTLDAVPNTLNFGNHELSDTTFGDNTYKLIPGANNAGAYGDNTTGADQDSTTKDPKTTDVSGDVYTQVTDVRGTQAGWTLTASLAEFENGGASTLKGATMTFADGATHKLTGTTGNLSWGTADITLTNPLALVADGTSQTVESAKAGTGAGTQQAYWSTDNVTLTVPKDTAKPGNSTSTITWTLTDAPGA